MLAFTQSHFLTQQTRCDSHCRQKPILNKGNIRNAQGNIHSAKVINTSAYNLKCSVVHNLSRTEAELLALTMSCVLASHPHRNVGNGNLLNPTILMFWASGLIMSDFFTRLVSQARILAVPGMESAFAQAAGLKLSLHQFNLCVNFRKKSV